MKHGRGKDSTQKAASQDITGAWKVAASDFAPAAASAAVFVGLVAGSVREISSKGLIWKHRMALARECVRPGRFWSREGHRVGLADGLSAHVVHLRLDADCAVLLRGWGHGVLVQLGSALKGSVFIVAGGPSPGPAVARSSCFASTYSPQPVFDLGF